MAGDTDAGEATALTPADWSSGPERRYAEQQARLAAHYGLDVDSHTVDTDAGRVHYLVTGNPDGERVVLLHGVSTTAATWLPLAPALTDDYRLYLPDRPGRGLSAAPSYRGRDLRQFMVGYLLDLFDDLGLERPNVVGNSLGGQQAFLLALDLDRVVWLIGRVTSSRRYHRSKERTTPRRWSCRSPTTTSARSCRGSSTRTAP